MKKSIKHYIYIYIFIYLKVVVCSTISIFRQQAAFVRNVQIKRNSLLPKYRDCTTYNDFEIYLMCCGVMLLLLIIYIYIYIYIYMHRYIYIYIQHTLIHSRPHILADFALKVFLK